jgi:hypothetical protein
LLKDWLKKSIIEERPIQAWQTVNSSFLTIIDRLETVHLDSGAVTLDVTLYETWQMARVNEAIQKED